MKTSQLLVTISTLVLLMVLFGCGKQEAEPVRKPKNQAAIGGAKATPENARLPENYGVYALNGGVWQALEHESSGGYRAHKIKTEIPSILIYDRRLAISSASAEQIANMRPAHHITRIIEERSSRYSKSTPDLVRYALVKTSMVVHVDSDVWVTLKSRPIAGRMDMMIVSPTSQLASGLYRVSIMGENYLLENESTMPPVPELILWHKTVDNEGGFSWSETFRGNPIDESSYRSAADYDALKEKLTRQLEGTVADLEEARTLAYQTAEYDQEMALKARNLYSSMLITTLKSMYDQEAYADVIECAVIAKNDNLLSAEAYAIYTNAVAAVAAIENADLNKWKLLMDDAKTMGKLIRRIPCQSYTSDDAVVEVYERGVQLIEPQRFSLTPFKTNTMWFGKMFSIEYKPEGTVGLLSPFGDRSLPPPSGPPFVEIEMSQPSPIFSTQISFNNKTDYESFRQAFKEARQAWEERMAPLNQVELIVRPGSWTHKIHLQGCAFAFDPAPGETRVPYEVRSSNGNVVKITTGNESLNYTDWLQFRSLAKRPLRLTLSRMRLIDKSEPSEQPVPSSDIEDNDKTGAPTGIVRIADINKSHIGSSIVVAGQVMDISVPPLGSRRPYVLNLRDDSGEMSIKFWQGEYDRIQGKDALPGANISARISVESYRGNLQYFLEAGANMEILTSKPSSNNPGRERIADRRESAALTKPTGKPPSAPNQTKNNCPRCNNNAEKSPTCSLCGGG